MDTKKPWTLAQAIESFATEEGRGAAREFEAQYERCVERLKTKAACLPIEKRNARMERGFKALTRKFGRWPPKPGSPGISSKNPKTRELMAALRSGEVTLSGLSGSIAGLHTKASPGDFATEWEFQPRACNGAGIAIRLATRLNPAVEFYYCEIEHARKPKAKRGPKEKYTWPPVEQKVFRLMDYHGDFMPGDLEWDQATLERQIADYMSHEFDHNPSESHLRKKVTEFRQKWLKQKQAAN
jgi:hypothetical protein